MTLQELQQEKLKRRREVLNAYTNKQLTNNSGVVRYPLTMANIDELLMAMKSYENVYVPKFG